MAIEIDGLPSKHGDFPWQTVSHNQRVYDISPNIKPFGDIYPSPNHHGDVTHRHVEASLEKSSSPIPSGYVKIAIEHGYL